MLLKIITFNVAHGRGTDNKVDIERQANLIKRIQTRYNIFTRSRYVHKKGRRNEPN